MLRHNEKIHTICFIFILVGNMKALQILSRHLLIWLLYTPLAVSAFSWLQGSVSKKRRVMSSRNDPANAPEAQRQFIICLLENEARLIWNPSF